MSGASGCSRSVPAPTSLSRANPVKLGRNVVCHSFSKPANWSISSSGSSASSRSISSRGSNQLGQTAHATRLPRCSRAFAQRASCGPSPSEAHSTPIDQLPFVAPVVASAKLVAAVLQFVLSLAAKSRDALHSACPQLADVKTEEVRDRLQQIKLISSGARMLAFVAPFAKAAASESLTAVYTRTFERAAFGFAKMYLFCLFMRVLLSWFPSIDWNAQPWTFLRLITEPYLQIYRGILPPLFGQLDFTPLFGFLILQDVVEVMAPTYTMGMHAGDTSTRWTTSDVMCYFDGF